MDPEQFRFIQNGSQTSIYRIRRDFRGPGAATPEIP